MASDAATRGFDVLRREIAVDRGLGLEGSVSFVTIDVGEISASAREREEATPGRKPTDVAKLSRMLLGVVRARAKPWSFEWLWNVWLGNRRLVGAGGASFFIYIF